MGRFKSKQVLRAAFWSFIVGVLMIVISFILPPAGVIDPTVMRASGMIFTFGAVVDALYSDKIVKITHKDTEIYIGDVDNK